MKNGVTLKTIEYAIQESYLRIYKNYAEPKIVRKEANFITTSLNLSPNAKLLDMGCGVGRHALELAKRGYHIIGIDISRFALNIAKQTSKKIMGKVNFLRKDLRRIDYKDKFDAVILMLQTWGLMGDTDNRKILCNASRALKKNGKLLLDLRNPYLFYKNKVYKNPELVGNLRVFTNQKLSDSHKVVFVERYFIEKGKKRGFESIVRLYTPQELKKIFQESGLKILKMFGDFSGRTYQKKKSPRLIIIGKKITK